MTSAEPLSSKFTLWVLVTAAKNEEKPKLFSDWSGRFEKVIWRSATFPVDTPPAVLDSGSFSYTITITSVFVRRSRLRIQSRFYLCNIRTACFNIYVL
jgi:hypothetical protein